MTMKRREMMTMGIRMSIGMKKEMKNVTFLFMLLVSTTVGVAKPRLHNLDIRVVLSRNGDAYITETRQMTVDDKGTE